MSSADGGRRVDSGFSRDALFRQAMAEQRGLVARIALSYEADPSLRLELAQDIWLAIWVALANYRGDSSLKTFIASIARRRCATHVTRRVREPRQVELPEDLVCAALTPDQAAMEKAMKDQLAHSIQRLPLPQREAIILCLEGFSYAEVGTILGISANAATLRCQRAKAALSGIMDRKSRGVIRDAG